MPPVQLISVLLLTLSCISVECYLVAENWGTFVSPSAKFKRSALTDPRPTAVAETVPSSSDMLLGSNISRGTALIFPRGDKPPEPEPVVEIIPSTMPTSPIDGPSEDSSTDGDGKTGVTGDSNGPDGQAVQRTFLVLAGLGIIIIGYLAIKFACVKTRRRDRDEEASYGLVETSEMVLLDNDEEEEEEEDDTLFDLHSHRRT